MMTDTPLVVLLLGVISVCLMVMTITLVVTARDVRRTLRRVNEMLTETRQMLARTQRITGHVEEIVRKGREAAVAIIAPVLALKDRAKTFFEERFGSGLGNGARSGPRRHH